MNIHSCTPDSWVFLLSYRILNTSPLSWFSLRFPSLSSCLPSLRELSNNRSLDNLDCIAGTGSSLPHWDDDEFSQACSTLGRRSCMAQVSIFAWIGQKEILTCRVWWADIQFLMYSFYFHSISTAYFLMRLITFILAMYLFLTNLSSFKSLMNFKVPFFCSSL